MVALASSSFCWRVWLVPDAAAEMEEVAVLRVEAAAEEMAPVVELVLLLAPLAVGEEST